MILTGGDLPEELTPLVDAAAAYGQQRYDAGHADGLAAGRAELAAHMATEHPQAPPTPEPDEGLFFAKSTRPSGRLVFAHYFVHWRSWRNEPTRDGDHYTTVRLNPDNPQWSDRGGHFTTRPLFRPPIEGDWQMADAVWEVETAKRYGLDGFFCDIISGGGSMDRYLVLAEAASQVGGFYVVPMLDCDGPAATNVTTASDLIAAFANRASTWMHEDKFVVSAFNGQKAGIQWPAILNAVAEKVSAPVFFMPTIGGVRLDQFTALDGIADGLGVWSPCGDVNRNAGRQDDAAVAHVRGKLYMESAGQHSDRRERLWWDECLGLRAMVSSWEHVIDTGPEFVQVVSWSDFKEGTACAPSEATGFSTLEAMSYWIERYKHGAFPEVLRDAVYVSNRTNRVEGTGGKGAPLAPGRPQTVFLKKWHPETPEQDVIEVATFLTAPDKVTVRLPNGQITAYDAPAGYHSELLPLSVGPAPVASTGRGSVATSPAKVVAGGLIRQDTLYYRGSSLTPDVGRVSVGPQ